MDSIVSVGVFVQQFMGREIVWGEDDCASFTAKWVLRCGGPDLMTDLWGMFQSQEEYKEALIQRGPSFMTRIALKRLRDFGYKRIDPQNGGLGDVAFCRVPTEDGPITHALCVGIGNGWYIGRIELGVTHIQHQHLAGVWSCRP